MKCAGYGETAGQEAVVATFGLYLSATDQNPSRLKATDQEVSRFLDFFLEQQGEGGLGDTDADVASDAEGLLLERAQAHKAYVLLLPGKSCS